MNTQTKAGVGVRLRLGLRFIISKKKGDVNMNMQTKVGVGVGLRLGFIILKKKGDVHVNMQTKVGVGVRLRLGLGFIILQVKVETNAISAQHSWNWS